MDDSPNVIPLGNNTTDERALRAVLIALYIQDLCRQDGPENLKQLRKRGELD